MNTTAIIGVSLAVGAGLAVLLLKYKPTQEPVIHDNLAGLDFYRVLSNYIGKVDAAHHHKVAAICVSVGSPDVPPDLAPYAEKVSRMGAKHAIIFADYDSDQAKVSSVIDVAYCKQMDEALLDTFRNNNGIILAD
ncbi:MAG: hypothetical protein Q4E43_01990 [Akkermansia sp.]|nr:hypothetical protein [Akkermansia sp.]